ncbi:hypothetical protein KGY63_05085 [Candidatus Bipolaricaulota bacterium]|nr:hypothetical protein [Candidatus Bipolaricaulota bacterium]
MTLMIKFKGQKRGINPAILRFALFLCVVICLNCVACYPGYAAFEDSRGDFDSNLTSTISIGVGTESFDYREYELGPLIELRGSLSTVNVSARFPIGGDLFVPDYTFGQIGGSLSRGELTYDGQTWGGDPLTMKSRDSVYRFKGCFGSAYNVDQVLLEAYGGFWIRYWANELEGDGGYRRKIPQLFWMGGASLRINASPNLSIGVGGEGYSLSSGIVKSYLSDVDPRFNDPVVEQDEGYGLKGYIRTWIDFFGLAFRVNAYGHYLEIEKSDQAALYDNGDKVTEVYEPDNTTTVFGIDLSLVWGS